MSVQRNVAQRLTHAAHRALAGRLHHVEAVRGGAVADQLAIDLGAAGQRVIERFHHHDAATAGDDEAVAIGVVGTRGDRGAIVVGRRQRAHAVEQHRFGPVQFLAAAGEYHVLLAGLDQLRGVADAVGGGGAGGRDGIAHALDPEGGAQAGGDGARHGARHHVRPDAAGAFLAQGVGGQHGVGGRGAAGAGNQAGARVRNLGFGQTGVDDGLDHRDVRVGGRIAHEAQQLAVDVFLGRDAQRSVHVAAKAQLAVFLAELDAGTDFAQRVGDLRLGGADAGYDAQPGDDDASHGVLSKVLVNRPTRRPLAV